MSNSITKSLEKIIAIAGSQTALAKELGIQQQAISEWLQKGTIPPHRVLKLEEIVKGAVTRHELRPDIYPRDPNQL